MNKCIFICIVYRRGILLHLKTHPDFICLGVQKSATTWLYKQFCNHPRFHMPLNKELRFFSPFFCKNIKRYMSFFKSHENHLSGDMTPEYFTNEKAAIQIKNNFPRSKLFVILRNPIDRALSHYRMALNLGNLKPSIAFIDCFLKDFNLIASKGLYDDQLLKYMNHLELNKNLKVFFYDDLIKSPTEFFCSICEYLNVEKYVPNSINECDVSKYKNDGIIYKKEDRLLVSEFYKKSIKRLSEILDKKISWI